MAKTLAEIALDEGLVDDQALAEAARLADSNDEPLVVALVRHAGVGEIALVGAIRRQARVVLTDPVGLELDSDALREVPREVCWRRRVLPLSVQLHGSGPRSMRLAMADPTDQVAIAEIEHLSGCSVEPQLMTLSAVEELTESGYRHFVTKVMKRDGEAVGEDLASSARVGAAGGLPDTSQTLLALVELLVDRGVLEKGELERAVRAMRDRRDDDT